MIDYVIEMRIITWFRTSQVMILIKSKNGKFYVDNELRNDEIV